MKLKQILCNLSLLLAAFIWGTTFVAQKSAAGDGLGPFAFNTIRCLIGSGVLLPLVLITESKNRQKGNGKQKWFYGVLCGALLFAATNLQQWGLSYTTAGKSGFVTALYVVLVPIAGLLIFKQKPGWNLWPAVALAVVGLYLLCVGSGFSVQKGDVITFLCALVFTFHILVIDKACEVMSGVTLSCIQFLVAGGLSSLFLWAETPSLPVIAANMGPLLYSGILSCGVAYTLQIVGQKQTNPTVASLLMSLESVFAVLAGLVVLHEQLTVNETVGCVLMFAAIIFAQLPLG